MSEPSQTHVHSCQHASGKLLSIGFHTMHCHFSYQQTATLPQLGERMVATWVLELLASKDTKRYSHLYQVLRFTFCMSWVKGLHDSSEPVKVGFLPSV